MHPRHQQTACLLGLLSVLVALPAFAQIHHLDDAPWYTLADSLSRRGSALSYDQYRDADTHWRTDRLGLLLHMGLGEHAVFYVNVGALRFDTGGLSVLQRWPELAQPDDDGEVDTDWPSETMINGFDRPELGLLFPLLAGDVALVAGLPVGRDELYPMSAACLPLRLDWRYTFDSAGVLAGAVRIGYEHTFDSGRDYLTAAAFPGGWRYGIEVDVAGDPQRGLALDWSARELESGHHLRRLRLTGWLPLGDHNVLELHLARDLGGKADRYATWIAGVTWRLAALPREVAIDP